MSRFEIVACARVYFLTDSWALLTLDMAYRKFRDKPYDYYVREDGKVFDALNREIENIQQANAIRAYVNSRKRLRQAA